MPQDLPPSGGYEPVQYKVSESIPPVIALRMADSGFFQKQRNLPARGFRPVYYLAAMGVIMTYGLYKVGQSNREQVELAREKMWSRIHLIPMLQAEEDRDQMRRYWADQAREKHLLGENLKVYHTDRFVKPTYAVTPEKPIKGSGWFGSE